MPNGGLGLCNWTYVPPVIVGAKPDLGWVAGMYIPLPPKRGRGRRAARTAEEIGMKFLLHWRGYSDWLYGAHMGTLSMALS